MGSTFTPRQGYQGKITFNGATVQFINVPTISGVERTPIEVTALYDGSAPFRSWVPGMYGFIEISGQIALDTDNDAVTGTLNVFNAGTTGTSLAVYPTGSATPLLTGSAGVPKATPIIDKEGVQLLDVTYRYCGSVTGTLCAGAT